MNKEPYSSSLDAFQLASVEGVLSQSPPLLQQRDSSRGQRSPLLTHLHQRSHTHTHQYQSPLRKSHDAEQVTSGCMTTLFV